MRFAPLATVLLASSAAIGTVGYAQSKAQDAEQAKARGANRMEYLS